ncbi:MAG: yflN 2 [Solirubrobacterales bacterium]|jgi:hydroxyacylglutathione hydrolase|nr:yflN 2 [Solirubrobacterales bacterium]
MATLKPLADDVFAIALTPRSGINAYLLGDVLVDAGLAFQAGALLKAVQGRPVAALALTHAHLDHAGGVHKVATTLGVPYWTGAEDAEAASTGVAVIAGSTPRPLRRPVQRIANFPAHPVARELHEGDELGAGFVVLATPGHSPGHVSFWRERDGILVCGDVLNGMNLVTTKVGLHVPPASFTPSVTDNTASAKRLAALRPQQVLFGHGPVWRDADALERFADVL